MGIAWNKFKNKRAFISVEVILICGLMLTITMPLFHVLFTGFDVANYEWYRQLLELTSLG